MPSAICFNLNQSKILSSGNGLRKVSIMRGFNALTVMSVHMLHVMDIGGENCMAHTTFI